MADLSGAAAAAVELLDRYGVEEPDHILEMDIAYAEGLRVVYGELGSAAARLTLLGGRGTIRLPADQRGLPWARFGVAHELGHFVLHQRTSGFCHDVDVGGWCVDVDREAEANAFAAELLMPRQLVRRECPVDAPSLDAVWAIAQRFAVSFPAAALRLMELTGASCAFAISAQGRVRWFRASRAWGYPPPEAGSVLPASALAARLAGTGQEGAAEVPIAAWTPGRPLGATLEACIDAPAYGRTVSLLGAVQRGRGAGRSDAWSPHATRSVAAASEPDESPGAKPPPNGRVREAHEAAAVSSPSRPVRYPERRAPPPGEAGGDQEGGPRRW